MGLKFYSVLSMLASFASVLHAQATGWVWLHTRVISVPGWRQEDCESNTILLYSMTASTKSFILLMIVLAEIKDWAVILVWPSEQGFHIVAGIHVSG